MAKIEVKLIFPPLTNAVSAPPAALAALKSYLTSRGDASVEIRDLNIEFVHYLINNWNELYPVIEKRLRTLLSRPDYRTGYLNQITRLLYLSLPLVSQMLQQPKQLHSEILVKALFEIVNCYYNRDLLKEGNFLFCEASEVNQMLTERQHDPIMNSFLRSVSFETTKLVGFSLLCESQLPYAMLLSKILKANFQHLSTVCGGAYITEIITAIQKSPDFFSPFDYIVVHEGESALHNICQGLGTCENSTHPNILSEPVKTKQKYLVEPISEMPPLDFDGLALELYVTPDLSLPVYSSKGCSWGRCAFCSLNSHAYREKSIEMFISELEVITRQTGVNHFQFVDENIPPGRLKLISEKILAQNLDIRWFIQTRFDKQLDANTLELMKQSGCYAIEFGLESGSPELLKKINKGISIRYVERILSYCEGMDFHIILNLMVGFPDETISDAKKTIAFLERIVTQYPSLRFSCNTQVVKIYKTSRYAKRSDIGYAQHELSTIAAWDGPVWLPKFQERFGGHFVFTGATQGLRHKNNSNHQVRLRSDPHITLSKHCLFLDQVAYDFTRQREISKPKSYMVQIKPRPFTLSAYELNRTMAALVKQAKTGESRLSDLRKNFLNLFSEYDRSEVNKAFESGVLRLNEMGAIAIW